jgi:hypothetical protein
MVKVVAEVGGRELLLSRAVAKEWYDLGFAKWIGRNRIRIMARFNPNGDFRGLSSIVGPIIAGSSEAWAKAFKQQQFLKRE